MSPRPTAGESRIIVLGYDGSDAARRALVRAAALARPRGLVTVVAAAPLLVHLGDAPGGRGHAPEAGVLLTEASERLHELGIESEEVAAPIDPADALIETARNLGADIAVVGTRGRGRAARTALGSVSSAVLRHAPCDVLVVRPGPPEGDGLADLAWPRAVLVGYDASPCARRGLERAIALVHPAGAVYLVFAIAPRARRARVAAVSAGLQETRDRIAERGITAHVLEQRGAPAAVIVDAARASNADLVVVGSHSHRPAARLILGSVSTAVVHRAERDVLVVRGQPSG